MAQTQEGKQSFVLYYSYRKHLQILTDEERGKLLMALMDYGESGKEPELDGAALMAFSFITCQMDRDAEKYAETCRKRSESGKKGGRPKKAEASEDKPKKAKSKSKKQSKAKKANGFSEKQSKAKKADNEYEYDNEYDYDNELSLPPLTPPTSDEETPNGSAEEVVPLFPYSDIVKLYHTVCTSYPKIKILTIKRKQMIEDRLKEHKGNLEAFRELFTKAEASDYLKGVNENGWAADFNWLLESENMTKVLEGKYDKRKSHKPEPPPSSFDTDEFFEAACRQALDDDPRTRKTAGEDEGIREKAEALKKALGQ